MNPAHASENQQDPPSSEPPPTKPPKGKKKKARATDTESIEVEESSTLPPADDTTDASENRPDPGPSKKPTKGKKKAKKADAEPGEAEADPSTVSLDDNDVNGTTNVPENPEPSEPPSKKPPKSKKKARATDAEPAETEAGPSTEPLEDGLNEGEPIPKKKRKRRENIADEAAGAPTTKKVKKAKVQNDVADANGGFHQQLADTINGSATGLNEAAASGNDAPPPKRTKPKNSTGGPNPKTKPQEQKTNGKVAEPILNGTSEKAEQSEGKAKRKKNKESKKEGGKLTARLGT
ncbi:hypothetical protein BT96DRAFT_7273 [Gymnopus androsaceus JB14]|uniref:Uncharacterized protein n=1 Tax=Gymnopus androsaceus JB14 TaxID=1447944 RepID=A0A6A4IRN9_9AGAR|nr:hypothetical protein BT96DRAFT_7273 [Gymnopus androsaceus JB14]